MDLDRWEHHWDSWEPWSTRYSGRYQLLINQGVMTPTNLPPRRAGQFAFQYSATEFYLVNGGDPFNYIYHLTGDAPFYSDVWKLNVTCLWSDCYSTMGMTVGGISWLRYRYDRRFGDKTIESKIDKCRTCCR